MGENQQRRGEGGGKGTYEDPLVSLRQPRRDGTLALASASFVVLVILVMRIRWLVLLDLSTEGVPPDLLRDEGGHEVL